MKQLLPPSGVKGQAWDGGCMRLVWYLHEEEKSEDRVPHSCFPLFIKNRPKHFMYHTKVSSAGGSHEEAWSRSTDFPPSPQGTGSQGAVAGPRRAPTKTACSGMCQLGVRLFQGNSLYRAQRSDARKCHFSAKINKWSEMETPVILLLVPRAWDLGFPPPTNPCFYKRGWETSPLETLVSPGV